MSTSTHQIKSADIKPGDIVRFEYGTYDNWVTARIDSVNNNSTPGSYYSQELVWHYLSDEEQKGTAALSQAGQQYRQHISYSNPNDIVEKLN